MRLDRWLTGILTAVGLTGTLAGHAGESRVLLSAEHSTEHVRLPEFTEEAGMKERRLEMVRNQLVARGIDDQRVLNAMERVPRQHFISPNLAFAAYRDSPLPIAEGQTISQPYIVALMTELLEVEPEHRLLEIGTGSGYQAAVLAELAREVVSIEIVEPLAKSASAVLEELGYRNITVLAGDGYAGWPERAPYDGIMVTAAAPHVPQPLVDQLKPGGRLVIPVGDAELTQELLLITKDKDGEVTRENLLPVRFVPLTGDR
ncbi:protein-L-isoaspartate(D-aspartate) O-methyltransferase [Marinimicrobium alkaliphilum]|uniref:protein-L-isoaspartate(D-aspartate) O-methyltransferase n=1 Tax=Marinimicrobium alkaliphilum TaxID=2202654 RepID=UPI001E4AA047|nr:protein-L-isoaspartate(D-aspartate) O-methyltransferase [Marinimicrobium alkaliphilum]